MKKRNQIISIEEPHEIEIEENNEKREECRISRIKKEQSIQKVVVTDHNKAFKQERIVSRNCKDAFVKQFLIFFYQLSHFVRIFFYKNNNLVIYFLAFIPFVNIILNSLLLLTLSDKSSFIIFGGFLVLLSVIFIIREAFFLRRIMVNLLHTVCGIIALSIYLLLFIFYFQNDKILYFPFSIFFVSLLILSFTCILITLDFNQKKNGSIIFFLLIILLIICFTFLFSYYNFILGNLVYLISTIYGILTVRTNDGNLIIDYAFFDYFSFFLLNTIYFIAAYISYPDDIANIDLIISDYFYSIFRFN